jgi:hypothetical protein
MGLTIVERARKKQASRITNLKEGDANTKNFHLKVNARRRKSLIHRLKRGSDWVVSHEEKEKLIYDHFSSIMDAPQMRSKGFN